MSLDIQLQISEAVNSFCGIYGYLAIACAHGHDNKKRCVNLFQCWWDDAITERQSANWIRLELSGESMVQVTSKEKEAGSCILESLRLLSIGSVKFRAA